MTCSLLLIRHAAPQVDPSTPAHTWWLSDKGRQSCYELAERLRPRCPTRILTSTEPKAQQTGQIIATVLQIPSATWPDLHEHDRSNVTGLDQETFQAQVIQLLTHPETHLFGRETGAQAQQRFTRAIHSARAAYPTDTLALVTHGTVMTLFVTAHNPTIEPVSWWQNLRLPDAYCLSEPAFYPINHAYIP